MIKNIIVKEEGFRPHPYLCSEGYVTIGYGTKLHNEKFMEPDDFSLNVSEESAYALLKDRVDAVVSRLSHGIHSKTYMALTQNRKDILVSMAYQMGVGGLYGFRNMWQALANGDYRRASVEMLDSRWAKQTPQRAHRHADVMATDDISEYK